MNEWMGRPIDRWTLLWILPFYLMIQLVPHSTLLPEKVHANMIGLGTFTVWCDPLKAQPFIQFHSTDLSPPNSIDQQTNRIGNG